MLKRSILLAGAAVVAFGLGRAVTAASGVAWAQPPAKDAKPAPAPGAQPAAKDAKTQPPAKGDKGAGESKEMKEMMEMMAKMQPGPQHKVLDVMLGTWEGTVKFKMAPEGEWMESKGSATREWIMDGRWLKEDVTGSMPGSPAPFKGLGLMGYNTIDKRYENAWFENGSTAMMTATGTYDAAKKVFTFTGEMTDPMSGKKCKMRSTMDVSSPTKETMEGFTTIEGGKEFKSFEGSFEKKK